MIGFSMDQGMAILAHALPGARLLDAQALGNRTWLLRLAERRHVVLRLTDDSDPWSGDPLVAEAAALKALRAEIDLPLPELLAYDDGAGMGTPYLICSHCEGLPLPDVLGELSEDQRYALGRDLGALFTRVHSYTASAYGPLDLGALPMVASAQQADELAPAPDADLRYLTMRLELGIAQAMAEGELDSGEADLLKARLPGLLAGTGQSACLVHGDLRPERVVLRRREQGWKIAGLLGWGFAQAWRPSWDHVGLIEYFADADYFSLRVGYGNAYDETTERRYNQLREFALLPFRIALFLEAGRADLALALVREAHA